MLEGSILSASIHTLNHPCGDRDHSQHDVGSSTGYASHNGDDNNNNTDTDDNEIQVHNGPHVLNYVCLAKTPGMSTIFWFIFCLAELYLIACNYPSNLQALARDILQPDLPLLTSCFVHFQLQLNNADPNIMPPYPDISGSPVSVFHSAVSMFYAPSDLSGLGGMHSECIWSTPHWRKGSA